MPSRYSVDDIAPAVESSGRFSVADIATEPAQPAGLPHPDFVDQQTTNNARAIAQRALQIAAHPPEVPRPPLPFDLQSDAQQRESALANGSTFTNPRTGRVSPRVMPGIERGPISIVDSPITGVQHIGEGVEQAAEPGMRAKAGAASKVIRGALETATPLLPAAVAAAPVATAASLTVGTGAQMGAEALLKKIGIPEEYAQFAGDLVGLFAAAKTPKTIAALRAKYEPILQTRAEKADAPEPTASITGREPYRPSDIAEDSAKPAENISGNYKTEGVSHETQHNEVNAEAARGRTDEQPQQGGGGAPEVLNAAEERAEARAPGLLNGATLSADAGPHRRAEGRSLHGDAPSGARPAPGEETAVLIPGEKRSIPARYEVRELADVRSSHNGNTFAANPDYELKNERDYSKPENQQRVIEQSNEEGFDPRYHINTTPTMGDGPALIDEHGNAIGGNSRTMHLQRIYGRGGRAAHSYRALLGKNAAHFGIDAETVAGMHQPVLVRAASPEGLENLPGGSQWAVRKTNISGTAALSASERAAADAGQMSPEMVQHIAGAIEDAGQDATLNDALTGKSGTSIVNHLIADGFFSEQERPALMDGKTGALTQLAKDRISKAMLGKFFRDADQIARTPASIRNKLERVAAPLAQVSGNPEWDITPDVKEALDLIEYTQAHGFKNLGDVVAQKGMFGHSEGPKWSEGAVKLAELLRDGKPNDVVGTFRRYVNSKDAGAMFGESTPAEAFRDVFGAEKPARAMVEETGPHGPVLRQFHHDAQSAIRELRQRQAGDAIGALHHPELGDIDLIWGKPGDAANDFKGGYGLSHIDAKHPGIAEQLDRIIPTLKKGEVQGGNRQLLNGPDHRAVVGLDWNDADKRWLLTAYEAPPSSEGFSSGSKRASAGEPTTSPQSGVSNIPQHEPVDSAPEPERQPSAQTTLGSGFGALQPYYDQIAKSLKASMDEVRALHAKREAALQAMQKTATTPAQKESGERIRSFFTGERDLWQTRVNQAIAKLKRLAPDHVEQEALSLMRDFRNRPGELQQFALGTHPDLPTPGTPEYKTAMDALEKIRPAIERALNPTPKMQVADAILTQIADLSLGEGKRLGFLDSSISADEYVTHLLHPKGEGEFAGTGILNERGQLIGGKIDRKFAFAKERTIPTLAHAVSYGLRPKTLNALDAFTIHGDRFATARSTRMLIEALKQADLGRWGGRAGEGNVPDGWVEVAPHAHPFRNTIALPGATSTDPPMVAHQTFFVPKYIEEALRPITDPSYLNRVSGFRKVRVWQAAAKAGELSLSVFHAKAENYMALANMGAKGWAKAQRADRWSPAFLESERDMVLHGGTSPIQGKTFEAYKSLQPGSIPTRMQMIRKFPAIAQFDQTAGKLSDFIFENQMRRFKVTNYAIRKAQWLAKNPNAMPSEQATAMRSIASELNAVYGGLHWENLGVNRMSQEAARFLMLAPDWTFSNVFNVAKIGESTPGGEMARAFWIRSILGGLAATQGYSLMMTGKPSRNPTMAYLGTDSQGREVYQNVAFAGAPSDAVNLVNNVARYGLFEGPARSLVGKTAPGFRTLFELYMNEDFLHHKITTPDMNWTAKSARGGIHVAKGVLPVPFSVTNLVDMLHSKDPNEQHSAKEIIGTVLFGQAAQHRAPGGTHMTKTGLRPDRLKPSKPLWKQISQ